MLSTADKQIQCESIKECKWKTGEGWGVGKDACMMTAIAGELYQIRTGGITAYLKQRNNMGNNLNDVIAVKHL